MSADHATKQTIGGLLQRLRDRVLVEHGGPDGVQYGWNLSRPDSLLHKEAAEALERIAADLAAAKAENERLGGLINSPHTVDFLEAVRLEAAHQRQRWASEHDAGKTDADWFWLIGYLAGKAMHKPEKLLHHIITTAAACLNWHAHRSGVDTSMRPGIDPPSSESA